MADILQFTGKTLADIPTRKMLDAVPDETQDCLVVGMNPDGSMLLASTTSDLCVLLMQIKLADRAILDMAQGGD